MTTKVLYSTDLISTLSNKLLFVDTNVFIGASICNELVVLLSELREKYACNIYTVSSVVYEYTRGSSSLSEFNDRRAFVSKQVDKVISVGRLLENGQSDVFSLVLASLIGKKDSAYTDFLLATCLYQFSKVESVYLMTADQLSMPRAIFDVVGVITCNDEKGKLVHYGIYVLNWNNFGSMSANKKFNLDVE